MTSLDEELLSLVDTPSRPKTGRKRKALKDNEDSDEDFGSKAKR